MLAMAVKGGIHKPRSPKEKYMIAFTMQNYMITYFIVFVNSSQYFHLKFGNPTLMKANHGKLAGINSFPPCIKESPDMYEYIRQIQNPGIDNTFHGFSYRFYSRNSNN